MRIERISRQEIPGAAPVRHVGVLAFLLSGPAGS